MRFTNTLAAFAASFSMAQAFTSGFNVAANNPDGSCLTTAQYTTAFQKLQALPQKFKTVRLYASSDCNQLALAVPAAISTGTQILVGVWTEDEAHYTAEKAALQSAIQAHGHSWIYAISVGSEDLYRGDTTASTLAGQVYDVRGMVRQYGVTQPVGHVDTWTAWVNSTNSAVITAVDFLGMDGYPYFQYSSIGDAPSVFWTSVNNTKNVAQGKPVWVTETGESCKSAGPCRSTILTNDVQDGQCLAPTSVPPSPPSAMPASTGVRSSARPLRRSTSSGTSTRTTRRTRRLASSTLPATPSTI